MRTAGILDAQQNLSVLIEEVKAGHDVTITDGGEPVAVLTAPKIRRESLGMTEEAADRLEAIILEDRQDRV